MLGCVRASRRTFSWTYICLIKYLFVGALCLSLVLVTVTTVTPSDLDRTNVASGFALMMSWEVFFEIRSNGIEQKQMGSM